METLLIGIAGGTSSGKSSIVKLIEADLAQDGVKLEMDAYYKAYSEYTLEQRKTFNYDHPDAFDVARFIEDLTRLKNGKAIDSPIYDYVMYTRKDETRRIEPHRVVVIEGLLIFWNEQLRDLFDLKIFVQTDSDERLIRRIRRDTIERGRSLESILTQYEDTVKPMHERFIQPTMRYADVIIPRGAHNTQGVEMLRQYIRTFTRKEQQRPKPYPLVEEA